MGAGGMAMGVGGGLLGGMMLVSRSSLGLLSFPPDRADHRRLGLCRAGKHDGRHGR